MKKYSIISLLLLLVLLLSSSKSSENTTQPITGIALKKEIKQNDLQMKVNEAYRNAWQSFVNRSEDKLKEE